MSEGNSGSRCESHEISVRTSLGTLRAEVVGSQVDYPGISVMLERPDGFRGFVSLTEVCDADLSYDIPAQLQTNCYDGLHEDPIVIDCDPDGPWMFEYGPQPNDEAPIVDRSWAETLVVLERRGEDALLFNPSNPRIPFIVAIGYDEESGTWSHGEYFNDVLSASCRLNVVSHPNHSVSGLTPSILAETPGLGLVSKDDFDLVCHRFNSLLAERVAEHIGHMVDSGDIARFANEVGESWLDGFQSDLDGLLEGKRVEAGEMGDCLDFDKPVDRDPI